MPGVAAGGGLRAATESDRTGRRGLFLKTIPGVGRILPLTILYEIHDITRFARVGDFLSYARLAKSQTASAGKVTGTSGAKTGNAHLEWAYGEAPVLFLQKNPPLRHQRCRLTYSVQSSVSSASTNQK